MSPSNPQRSPDAPGPMNPMGPTGRRAVVRPALQPLTRRILAWAALGVVLLGLFNLGLRHRSMLELAEQERAEAYEPTTWEATRRYLADDGDVRRYFAYCNAMLGRTFHGFYVRTLDEWQQSFRAFGLAPDPDETPEVSNDTVRMPYRDYVVEYPPGFFLLATPPALLTRDPDRYLVYFGALMTLLVGVSLLAARRLSRQLPGTPVSETRLVAWTALASAALGTVVTHRYDAVLSLAVCMMLLAAFERRPILLGLSTGFGIGTKLVPLIVAPVLLLLLLRGRRFRELALATAVTAATALFLFAPGLAAAGVHFFDVFRYHGERPLQIETTAAAVLGLLRVLDPDSLDMVHSYGSTNVVGTYTGLALKMASCTPMLGLLAVYAWTFVALRREPDEKAQNLVAARATVATLVAFMAGGKVFSPQYLVWLVPLGLLLSLKQGRGQAIRFVALLGLTQVVFPATYRLLEELNPLVCLLVLVRNLMLLHWGLRFVVPTVAERASLASATTTEASVDGMGCDDEPGTDDLPASEPLPGTAQGPSPMPGLAALRARSSLAISSRNDGLATPISLRSTDGHETARSL